MIEVTNQTQTQTVQVKETNQAQINQVKDFLVKQGLPLKAIVFNKTNRLVIYVPVKLVSTASFGNGIATITMRDRDDDDWELIKLIMGKDGIIIRPLMTKSRHLETIMQCGLDVIELAYDGVYVKIIIELKQTH